MNTMEIWHEVVKSKDPKGLDAIIAEDCIFHSPVIHTPQEGKDLTKLYLAGAVKVFNDSFHYLKEVVNDDYAILEFVCAVDGITINGVDIISFDDAGKIKEFKVMIRPMKGVTTMAAKMVEALND
ncbi:MAG: hypothetical protein ACJAUG_003496 [Halioglobus sp.]|jgi:hypothetical protein